MTAPRPRKEVSRTVIAAAEIDKVPGTAGDPLAVVQNFAGVARALGIPAQTVRELDDLEALDGWTAGPFLLDCKVDPRIRAEWLQEAFRGGA